MSCGHWRVDPHTPADCPDCEHLRTFLNNSATVIQKYYDRVLDYVENYYLFPPPRVVHLNPVETSARLGKSIYRLNKEFVTQSTYELRQLRVEVRKNK